MTKGSYENQRILLPALTSICIAAVILAGLTAAGRMLSPDSLAETVPVHTDPIFDYESIDGYDIILQKYEAAAFGSWTKDRCEIEGISPRMQADADLTKVGYARLDLDGDGRDELLIAEESVPHIDHLWDVYTTLEDGTPIQLWVDECDGNQCYLYEGNILGTEYTTKTEAEYLYYTLESGKLVMREGIWYEDEDAVFYMDASGNERPVTSKEAMDISARYDHQKLNLIWLADLSDYLRNPDSLERYTPVLEKYRTALTEKWDMEQCSQQDISLMISSFADDADRICAFFLDLDDNGVQELMITDGMMIYDLYTLKNGEPVKLLTGWERNSYRLCLDNVIYNQGSGGAASSLYNYYLLQNGELVLMESVIFDGHKDPENPWFRSYDGETPEEPMSEEEAREIMDSYKDISILGTKVLEMA